MKKIRAKAFPGEVIKSEKPVVAEFYADWSGTAFIISDLLEELEEEYGKHVKFVLINIEKPGEIMTKYGINKIPTILFFNKGKVINQLEGMPSRKKIKELLDEVTEQIKH